MTALICCRSRSSHWPQAVTAAFDGGRLTSDGGVMLLRWRACWVAEKTGPLLSRSPRPAAHHAHAGDMVRARILAIAAATRTPTISTLARRPLSSSLAGAPDTGKPVSHDPVAVGERALAEGRDPAHVGARRSMDGLYERSRVRHFDIDDTCDVVHGHQQLSLFNAHYDERASCRSMSTTRTLASVAVCCAARRRRASRCERICAGSCAISVNTGRKRASLPRRRPLRPPRRWNGVSQPRRLRLRLPGSKPLAKKIDEAADAVRTERALSNSRSCAAMPKHAQGQIWSPSGGRRRIKPRRSGSTPLRRHQRRIRPAEWIYDALYCAADRPRTSSNCTRRSSLRSNLLPFRIANQVRLVLHRRLTGLCSPSATHPETARPRQRQILTLRLRLIKIAAASSKRNPRSSRFRRRCPEADLFRGLPAPRPLALERGQGAPHPSSSLQRVRKSIGPHGEIPERTRAPKSPKPPSAKPNVVMNRKAS